MPERNEAEVQLVKRTAEQIVLFTRGLDPAVSVMACIDASVIILRTHGGAAAIENSSIWALDQLSKMIAAIRGKESSGGKEKAH